MPQIAFIGGGVMAEAMITAIIENSVARPDEIVVGEIDAERRDALSEKHGVRAVPDNADAVMSADSGGLNIIALKPQHIEALSVLRTSNPVSGPFLSIAAGVRIDKLRELTGCEQIIRVMPNTPAQIGHGMSVWMATPDVKEPQRDRQPARSSARWGVNWKSTMSGTSTWRRPSAAAAPATSSSFLKR